MIFYRVQNYTSCYKDVILSAHMGYININSVHLD